MLGTKSRYFLNIRSVKIYSGEYEVTVINRLKLLEAVLIHSVGSLSG